jgi:hypothetical protein
VTQFLFAHSVQGCLVTGNSTLEKPSSRCQLEVQSRSFELLCQSRTAESHAASRPMPCSHCLQLHFRAEDIKSLHCQSRSSKSWQQNDVYHTNTSTDCQHTSFVPAIVEHRAPTAGYPSLAQVRIRTHLHRSGPPNGSYSLRYRQCCGSFRLRSTACTPDCCAQKCHLRWKRSRLAALRKRQSSPLGNPKGSDGPGFYNIEV